MSDVDLAGQLDALGNPWTLQQDSDGAWRVHIDFDGGFFRGGETAVYAGSDQVAAMELALREAPNWHPQPPPRFTSAGR